MLQGRLLSNETGPNRVLKKSAGLNGFLSAQPAAFVFGSLGAYGMRA